MTNKALSENNLKTLPIGEHRDINFKCFPGVTFGIRVQKGGTRSFWCRIRKKSGGRPRLPLGRYPGISLSEAKSKALELAHAQNAGRDVIAERDLNNSRPSIGTFSNYYLTNHANQKKDGGKADESRLNRFVIPAWGDLQVNAISKRQVKDLLDKIAIERGRVIANRVRSLLNKFFNYAIEFDHLDKNPCLGTKPFREQHRTNFLEFSRIKDFWSELDKLGDIRLGSLFKVILLTGQRGGEVSKMRWSELNSELTVWTLPQSRTKNGRGQTIPISSHCRKLLTELRDLQPRENSGEDYVFQGVRKSFIATNTYQCAMQRVRKNLNVELTTHDLRRTASELLADARVSRCVISRILNHTDEGPKTTKVYLQHERYQEVRDALELLGNNVSELVMV